MVNLKSILEEIAVTEDVQSEQPIEDSQIDEQVTENTDEQVDSSEIETPSVFNIDGEELTIEQIKEFRQGYLRQSDYTKKTQNIAQEREKLKEAVELYDYLQANPEVAQRLVQEDSSVSKITPTQDNQLLKDLSYKIASMELDTQLNLLKSKDPDLNEIELLTIANERGLKIEDAYDIYRGKNLDKILEKRLKEQSANLTKQIQQNGNVTKTLISGADKPNINNHGLSDTQLAMARKLDMTPEEYKKWL